MARVKRIKLDEAIEAYNENYPLERKKTRKSVARALGVSYQSLSRMNAGEVGKGVQTINSLAEELRCEISNLIEKE